MPCQFKNIDGAQYVVAKRGYIVVRWLEYNNETEELNYTNKRDFIISPQNVDMILGIDPHNPKITDEGEVSFYSQPDDPITKVFRIKALPDGDFNFLYADLQDEKSLVGQMEIRLKKG